MITAIMKRKNLIFVLLTSLFFIITLSIPTSEAHVLIIADGDSSLSDMLPEAQETADALEDEGYEVLELYQDDATTKNIMKGMYNADAIIYLGHGGYQSGNYDLNGGPASPPFALVGSDGFVWGIGNQIREGWYTDPVTMPSKSNIPVILSHACFSTGWVGADEVANPTETIYNFSLMFTGAGANYYSTAYYGNYQGTTVVDLVDEFLDGATTFTQADSQNWVPITESNTYNGAEIWRNDGGYSAFVGDWTATWPTASQTTPYDDVAAEAWYQSLYSSTDPPEDTTKLIFIHHSCGENWLSDGNGGLGISLRNNNYFVSDTNYGWGPDGIGSSTDIGNWWEWFRGPDSATYLAALYAESGQNSAYSRLATDPGGENEIIMFKSCYPNSALKGNINDPVPAIGANPLRGQSCGSAYHTVANAKGIYIDLLEYFKTRQDKMFVIVTAPPLRDSTYAANARYFNNWLVNDWLDNYPYKNVFVFDFYNVLTSNGGNANTNDLNWATGNHHRIWNGEVQHQVGTSQNTLAYPTGDDHPSRAGNLKATGEFTALLNNAYNEWKSFPFTGTTRDVYMGGSIQAAINLASPNDIIMLHGNSGSPVTYTENLTVNKQLLIRTANDGTVTITAANPNNPTITVTTDGRGSQIEGLTIRGATNSNGIYLNNTLDCKLIGNTITANYAGIKLFDSNINTIHGNHIYGNTGAAIILDHAISNNINGNEINNNPEGLYIANSSNYNTIEANNIHENTGNGINILSGSIGNNIIGNTAISQNGVIGIMIRDSDTNNITGNIIGNNGWAGIALDNSDGNTINGANIISGNQEGLHLTGSAGNTITGNSITDNDNIGISLINSSSGNYITGNTSISNNGIIGVFLRDSGTNTVSGNTIQNNSWVGVCFDNAPGNTINSSNNISGNMEGLYLVNNSNNNTIGGNNIHNNTDTGIYIDSSTGNQINTNTAISSNNIIGILLRNANSNTISGNTLTSNGWTGIALDNSDNNNINGTNIISGSQMGVYLVNTSNGNTITGNTVQNNTWAGIVLDTATNTTVHHNNFTNNPLQALAQNGSGNAFYQTTTGNYWSDWASTNPRPIAGNEGLTDQYPRTTPF